MGTCHDFVDICRTYESTNYISVDPCKTYKSLELLQRRVIFSQIYVGHTKTHGKYGILYKFMQGMQKFKSIMGTCHDFRRYMQDIRKHKVHFFGGQDVRRYMQDIQKHKENFYRSMQDMQDIQKFIITLKTCPIFRRFMQEIQKHMVNMGHCKNL